MGGARERHFDLFKQWAHCHTASFWSVLCSRYVMYGEWLYAKHTVFYNHLPHYFMEFDILDTVEGQFLSTERRRELLAGLPVVSVKVLFVGILQNLKQLTDPSSERVNSTRVHCLGPSYFIRPGHMACLRELCEDRGLDAERVLQETDPSTTMEGLYIKVEEEGIVKERYKYVRASFLTTVVQSGSHWLERPIIPNQLAPGIDIFTLAP